MIHPINIGITLLTQTIIIAILIGLISYSSWFSYILFLVFLGGILVLFIYITRIASNEIFKKRNYIYSIIIIIIVLAIIIIFLDPFIFNININYSFIHNTNLPTIVISPLYNNPISLITVFIVLYLLLTLIVIVSLTKFNKGPLRPIN